MKFLYNEELQWRLFCTKTDLLLTFKITELLAKLQMVGSRLVSNDLFFFRWYSTRYPVSNFVLLSSISELSIGAKIEKLWYTSSPVKHILPNNQSCPFSDTCANFFVKSVSFVPFSLCFVYLR